MSVEPLRVVEIDYRQILQNVLGGNAVMGQAVRSGVERTCGIKLTIDFIIAIMRVIVRRVTGKRIGDVAVRVGTSAGPADQNSLEITLDGMLHQGRELSSLDADVEPGVLRHGLNDLGHLQRYR